VLSMVAVWYGKTDADTDVGIVSLVWILVCGSTGWLCGYGAGAKAARRKIAPHYKKCMSQLTPQQANIVNNMQVESCKTKHYGFLR